MCHSVERPAKCELCVYLNFLLSSEPTVIFILFRQAAADSFRATQLRINRALLNFNKSARLQVLHSSIPQSSADRATGHDGHQTNVPWLAAVNWSTGLAAV